VDDPTEILRAGGNSVAGDIDELKRAVEGLRSEIKSFLATYNSNNVEIRQGSSVPNVGKPRMSAWTRSGGKASRRSCTS
jgi:hypothetical protein